MMNLTSVMKVIIVSCLGVVLIALGLILGLYAFPSIYESKLRQTIRLTEGSDMAEKWANPPVPIYMKIYMFNITNPDKLDKENVKLQQLGPYTYTEIRGNRNVTFHPNGTVEYHSYKAYLFTPEMSSGLESDIVTTLNVPLISAIAKFTPLKPLVALLLQTLISRFGEKLTVTKSVGELLFHGYNIEMVDILSKKFNTTILPGGKFGLRYGSNGTTDGPYLMDTGVKDSERFGTLLSYKHETKLDFWGNDKYCNMINGSDGGQYPPFVSRDQRLYIFNSDLCRSLYVEYEKDVELHGLTLYRFSPPKLMLADSETNPDNKCYCSPNGCQGAGVIDLSVCLEGKPVMMSTPHFYQGAVEYQRALEGISPSKERHQTYLDIDPYTGAVLRAHKRLQVNIFVRPVKNFPMLDNPMFLKNSSGVVFPIFWFDETGELSAPGSVIFYGMVLKPLDIMTAVQWAIVGVGVLVLVICIIYYMRTKKEYVIVSREENGVVVKAQGNGVPLTTVVEPYKQENGNPA